MGDTLSFLYRTLSYGGFIYASPGSVLQLVLRRLREFELRAAIMYHVVFPIASCYKAIRGTDPGRIGRCVRCVLENP